jgi:hypothetical protein
LDDSVVTLSDGEVGFYFVISNNATVRIQGGTAGGVGGGRDNLILRAGNRLGRVFQ